MASSETQTAGGNRDNSTPLPPWLAYWEYAADCWQRNVLFLDVMRRRGNQFLAHAAKPVQHVLRYDFEKVMDGCELARPVNYGLVRVVPPDNVEIDETLFYL